MIVKNRDGQFNLSPHHSRRLLLQPPIRRYDKPDGGRARRSVSQHTVSSMPCIFSTDRLDDEYQFFVRA
jgi:hypothetical protein